MSEISKELPKLPKDTKERSIHDKRRIEKMLRLFRLLSSGTVVILAIVFSFIVIEKLGFNENEIDIDYKKEFFETADKIIIEQDSLPDSEELLKNVFNSINRETKNDLNKYGFVNLLEDYLVYLVNDTIKYKSSNYVFNIIQKEKKLKPFFQLPKEQRRILINLDNAITNNNIKDAKYNLSELNDIMKINNDNMKDLEYQSKWSVPLAFIGLFATLILGFIGIRNSLSRKDMEEFKKELLSNTEENNSK